jgi:aryl-alcohol dehydrogenase (NADP+)
MNPSTPTPSAWRPLGHSGLKVPRLWLGAMMFGDQADEAACAAIIDAAREQGLTAIDTADIYAQGRSEAIVGRAVARDRERWIVASKLANPVGDAPNDRGTSRHWMLRAVDASLKRLNTDWIDLYYCHRDDESTPVEETVATMARLIEQGRIRYWAVSNFRAWRVAQYVGVAKALGVPAPIASQSPYSLVSRGIETELLPACAALGLGVVAYSPLARGVLTGKYAPGEAPPAGTRAARKDRRLMQTEWRPESVAIARDWAAHAAERGVAAGPLAIAWALANPLVQGVIAGPRTLAQWQDYVAALAIACTPQDEAWVNARVPAGHASSFGYTDPLYPVTGRPV